jgi:hypothetical protein
VSVNWTLGTVTGEDSFDVKISAGGQPAQVTRNDKPSVWTGLGAATWTATVTYKKTGCTDKVKTQNFTISGGGSGFASTVMPVLVSYGCAGCHISSHSTGLNLSGTASSVHGELTSESPWSDCVGGSSGRVKAGDAANSVLYRRLLGTCGARMPFGGSPIASGDLTKVESWINAGALND